MKDEKKSAGTESEPESPGSGSSFILQPSSFHRIRLGPPWSVTSEGAGTRHARKFGRPRTLDADERLWLVCAYVPGPAEVSVNGAPVGTTAGGPFAADVTSLLLPRNEVAFAVPAGGALGAVALEVRPA